MTRLLLVRHGETEANKAGRLQGHTDGDLSPLGCRQIELLRDALADEPIDAIYSSDLRRATHTAEIIASGRQKTVITSNLLREIDYGKLQGLTLDEIEQRYPKVSKDFRKRPLHLKIPGGESVDQLRGRVDRFLSQLKLQPEQTILIAAHGGPLRFMIRSLLGIDPRHWQQLQLDPASLSIINIYPEITVLSKLNDTSHLK
jgi:alpha-ribazole phosphatase